jgi:hypothetical protein
MWPRTVSLGLRLGTLKEEESAQYSPQPEVLVCYSMTFDELFLHASMVVL